MSGYIGRAFPATTKKPFQSNKKKKPSSPCWQRSSYLPEVSRTNSSLRRDEGRAFRRDRQTDRLSVRISLPDT